MFSRILVPTDFSAPSDAALEYARVVAGTLGASVHVLHVMDAPAITCPMCSAVFVDESPPIDTEAFEDARIRLAHRVTANDRIQHAATTDIVFGAPARAIVSYATEREMDLIIMGTHGRSGVAHGSVAARVVRAAPCPVLTVREAPIGKIHLPEPLVKELGVAAA